MNDLELETGKPLPLGAIPTGRGINFAVFSRYAFSIILVLFESDREGSPCREIVLDPEKNRTGDIWHCHIPGLKAGALYLYRADGPYIPERGFRFNVHKALIDPYAKALTSLSGWDMKAASGYNSDGHYTDASFSFRDNIRNSPRCVVIDDSFDWQGDRSLNYPLRHSVLYETHVRGLSARAGPELRYPGTYRGVVEKIPYFKKLGITSLEFLPIQEFNENEVTRTNPATGETLTNYWGYSTVAFFAPKLSYSSDQSPGAAVREFKEMVRELHKAGLEVILDIVFNHTAEGSEMGPTISFRGFDNTIYYILDENKRYYRNYSGCGNTVNCNHPVIRTFILDCLRYWVVEMHVDGFRFDLGSILGRDQDGSIMEAPPVLQRIAEDPVLRHTKIIAEAWDAGGAYQVGWFPGGRWAEWNDRFRDDVRQYWRGGSGTARHLATRLAGSSDLYLRDGRKPFHSINFFSSHDGFTLGDLVSYERKHNEENGEDNRDGSDNNLSANYGTEGPSDDPFVKALREKIMKNFFATLLLSQGTPMMLGGDEFGRTQKGNNNAYCQNNEISWYDWSLVETNRGLFRFVRKMIAFRLHHPAFMRPEFYTGRDGNYNSIPDISWFDETGTSPDWGKLDRFLALRMDGSRAETEADRDDNDFFIMFNSSDSDQFFTLVPPAAGKTWLRAIDSSFPSPEDIIPEGAGLKSQNHYLVRSQSIAVLLS
ncbi:MAG: glycogen debranching protein GlgX [Spirochaetaceae bacterium]|jgi:glycogen operon protein|nr:glycogen debranching protein GlgX [Spirochaetaceae bacterium]